MKNYTLYNLFKNHFLLLFIAIFCTHIVKSQTTTDIVLAKRYGGAHFDGLSDMVTDASGNIYMTGSFFQKTMFGNIVLTTQGSIATFVTKTDPFGNVLWAKQFDTTSSNLGVGITLDTSGNIYTTGRFSGTATFGTFTLDAQSDSDIFVVKQDSEGNVLWVSQFVGTQNFLLPPSSSQTIVADTQGNVYTVGNFGADSITFGDFILTRPTGATINTFVVKQDPLGNVLWAKNFGETKSTYVKKITIDTFDNSYIIGNFWGTVNFGGTTLSNLDEKSDIFLVKLDTSGEVIWARQFKVTSPDQFPASNNCDITIDEIGNIYLTGDFYGTLEVGATTLTSSSIEVETPFVIKTNNLGEPLWAKRFTCNDHSSSTSITSDTFGNIYITGVFKKNIDFDGITFSSFGSNHPDYPDYPDAFVLKMNNLGTVEWAN